MTEELKAIVNALLSELDEAFNAAQYTAAGLIIEALDSLNEIGENEIREARERIEIDRLSHDCT